jgi:hypothetical protein
MGMPNQPQIDMNAWMMMMNQMQMMQQMMAGTQGQLPMQMPNVQPA